MITRDDLQLRILSCMSMEGSGFVKYRDDVNKISAVTITPRKDELSYGKPKTTYYIDNVEKEFTDLDELIDFYNEKFRFEEENPDQEITFVKVIKRRNKYEQD